MDQDGILSSGWIAAIYGSAATLSATVAMRGLMIESDQWILFGIVSMILTITTLPICIGLRSRTGGSDEQTLGSDRIRTELKHLHKTIELLNENLVLSDDARRVLNRRRERELLCKAIEEDIELEDWGAGLILVRELAERFGYREEAEGFRTKIETARSTTTHKKVHDAIAQLDTLVAEHQWDRAMNEAARISRVYHESSVVEGLRHRVESAKDRYKHDIERRFLLAAQEERIDQAMDLLKEMDQYLSEHEAEQFQEVARGVIGKARDNLGVQFKLAVHDKAWDQAAIVGQRIIEEFPNSRMAGEVRTMIDSIRKRAGAITR